MMELLASLEAAPLSVWLRESSSIWAYPTVLTAHTLGLAVLVGASWALDLRLLGFGRAIPLETFAGSFRVMWVGFWVNALSGALLWAAVATTKGIATIFLWKLAVIALCIVVMMAIKRLVYGRATEPPSAGAAAKLLATASLALWVAAIALGRWMAYAPIGEVL